MSAVQESLNIHFCINFFVFNFPFEIPLQIVNGRPLPTNLDYSPTNSFDENGIYNGTYHKHAIEGIYKSREKTEDVKKNLNIEEEAILDSVIDDEDVQEICVGILGPLVSQEVLMICTHTMNDVKEAVKTACETTVDVINSTVREELKTLIENGMREYQCDTLSSSIYDDIFKSVARKQIKEIVEEELMIQKRKAEHEKRMKIFHSATEVSQDFLWGVIERDIADIAAAAIRRVFILIPLLDKFIGVVRTFMHLQTAL